MASSGMRKGEALAIQFKDIYKKIGTISVSKSVYFEINKPRIKEPKTSTGVRIIPILKPLAKYLKKGKPEHHLFSTNGGLTPLTKSEYQRRWEKLVRETGIKMFILILERVVGKALPQNLIVLLQNKKKRKTLKK